MKKIILALLLSTLMITAVFAAELINSERISQTIGTNRTNQTYIELVTETYDPDTTGDLEFMITYESFDWEWVEGVSLTFPAGVTINSATDIETMAYNAETGDGITVSWGDLVEHSELGAFHAVANFTVNVTIASSFSGYMAIEWFTNGDGYGDEPHTSAGTLTLPQAIEGTPENPILVSPANGVINVDSTESLEWTTGANTDHAVLYIADNADFTDATMINPATSPYSPTLDLTTTYYWKVVVYGPTNITVSSATWSFTTAATSGIVSVPLGIGTTSAYQFPWNFFYKNSVAETIYLAEELNIAGQMQGLTYYNNFVTDLSAMPVNIWIGETTQTDLSTYIPPSQLTAVFAGTVDFPAGTNSINITFDTPYNYGGGNLVILTERELDEEYYSSSDIFFNTETELTNRTMYWQSDSVNLDPATVLNSGVTAYISDSMPNITFYLNVEGMGSLAGTITDGTTGLEGVNITINNNYYPTTTRDDGSFEIPFVVPGENYILTASLLDYYDETTTFNIIENQESQVSLVLEIIPFIAISGQITSALTNTGIPATVSLTGIRDYSVTADSTGNFILDHVYANNSYDLEVSYQGYDSYYSVLAVQTGDIEFNPILGDLTVPNNLTASMTNGQAILTWDDINNQDRAWLGYNIYRNDQLLNTESIMDTEYADNDIIYGETYSYKITSILDEGESAPSNVVEVYAVNLQGSGTQAEPYLINDLADLRILSEKPTLWNSNYYYEQTANIDASDTQTWNNETGFSPIGNITLKFSASYDGKEYLISNLYINRQSSNIIGLFGYTSGANLANIVLEDNNITGQHYVGGLVGYSSLSSTISNSSVTGSVTGTGTQIGGLVGYSSATTISKSFTSGDVSGTSTVGGLVGKSNNSSTFNNCYAIGDVSGTSNLIGGLVGYSNSPTNYCYASGNVSGVGTNIGGLVGGSTSGSVNSSFWDINTTNQASSAGGTGLATTEMQTYSTYIDADWDFQDETNNGYNDIWVYYDNHYPRLSWDRTLEPDFTVNQTTISFGTDIQFINTSLGSVNNFFWEFGDGYTSYATNPIHTYSGSGIYSVTLTISNSKNIVSLTKTDYITVNAAPDISVNPLEITEALATGDSSTRYLTISNNGQETLNATLEIRSTGSRNDIPELIYGQASSSEAIETGLRTSKKLTPSTKDITSSRTGSNSVAAYNPHKPIVAINAFPKNDKYDGDFVQLISNTIDLVADPYEWLTLSETDISIAPGAWQTIEVNFNSEDLETGTYTKSINISSNDPDEALINIPVALNVIQNIEASFTADSTEILTGESVQFTDLTVGSPNHWKWYLDNDEEVDSYLQNPSFTYSSNGTYSVSLVASYIDDNNIVVVSDSLSYSNYITVSGTSMGAGSYSGSWGLDSSPYNIYGSILIEEGTTLTIEAGTEINFMVDTDFTIGGQLLADGVIFTSPGTDSREEGVWQGITFTASNSNSSLTNSIIENATKGIEIIDASPTLRGLEFKGLNREYPAIKISGNSNAILEDLDINDFDNGVEILGEDSDNTPVITNIRVRHTTNTRNNTRVNSGIGINISGPANVQMTESFIEGFATGLKLSGDNSSTITQNAIINNITAIELSGADCSPQIHHNHLENQLEETATIFDMTNIIGIQILNNNILGFNIVVSGENSTPYFGQNIIWGASIPANQLSTGTNLSPTFEYNNVSLESGIAPGTGNMNFDPLFVEDDTYNLQLSIDSECIDAGNPNLALDPDGSVADLGMNYVHHLADFDSDDRFSNTGTIVEFENNSEGHNETSTSILWEFGDGDSSIERNPIHLYGIPGAYDVTLTMTTGSYTDVITRESFIIVQGQALSAPQNPAIVAETTGINLSWEEVTPGTTAENVVYFIYSCNDPLGTYDYRANVTSLNWTDENISQTADKQFYFVIAYPTSVRTDLEAFINSHRYMTRDGEVVQLPTLKKMSKNK